MPSRAGLGAEHCQIFRIAPGRSGGRKPRLDIRWPRACGDLDKAEAGPALAALKEGTGAAELLLGEWRVLAAPARYQSGYNGAAVLWRKVDRGAWSDDDRLLIGDIGNQIGITIEQLRHHEHVLRISRTDALTGLLNRGAFIDGLRRYLSRQHRDAPGRLSSLLMYVDLDNFMQVNDTKGHQAGDDVLQKVRGDFGAASA